MHLTKAKPTLNEVSGWYSSFQGMNGFMIKCLYQEFKPWLRESLLEVGAADGYMTKLINEDFSFQDYDIVEGSSDYCKKLQLAFPSLHIHNAMIEEFETTKKYNTIIASHVLEHVPNPLEFLAAVRRLLADGGVFLASVPNALSFHRLLGVEMGVIESPTTLNEQDKKIGHYRVYDQHSFAKDLKGAGLKINKLSGSYIKFLSNSQTEKLIPKDEWKYFYQLGKRFPDNCADLFVICST